MTYRPYSKETLCRMTLEPQGLEVLEFWEDDEGYGCCKARNVATGELVIFTQKPQPITD